MIDNRIEISLSPSELKEAKEIGKRRSEKEKIFGTGYFNTPSIIGHTHGVISEWGCANLFDVDFDREIFEYHGDRGYDLVLPGVGNCEVKVTTYTKHPMLRVERHKIDKDVDVYMACCINKRTLRCWFVGWADKELLKSGKSKRLRPDGPLNYILLEQQLRDPLELLYHVASYEGE